jgi:hypothetical protein
MPVHYHNRWYTVLLLVSLFGTVPGCGSKFSSAEGHVSFDGQPIQEGTISFDPVDGQVASAGCAIQGGEYKIDRILPGKKIVRITAQKKTGRKVPLSTIMPASMCPPGAMTDEIVKYIPACYHEQSELTAEVTSGRNTFEFDLKPR